MTRLLIATLLFCLVAFFALVFVMTVGWTTGEIL